MTCCTMYSAATSVQYIDEGIQHSKLGLNLWLKKHFRKCVYVISSEEDEQRRCNI